MAETKAAFRRRVGRLLRTLHTVTTDGSGSTTTFTATPLIDLYPTDQALDGAFAYDSAASEWRRVSNWVASSGVATVGRAFTNSEGTGRAIEIYEQFNPQILDDALQQALSETYPYIATRVVDESLAVIALTYEYTVPSTIRELNRMSGGQVKWQANTAVTTFPYIEFDHWDVRESGSTKALLLPDIQGRVGRTIRIIGHGSPTFPATDATTIDLEDDPLQLLAFKVAEIVWRTGPSLTGQDAAFAQQQQAFWAKMYNDQKNDWGVLDAPGRMETPDNYPLRDFPLAYNRSAPS